MSKPPILNHFDLEHHIRILTGASGFVISKIVSQLTLDSLGRWHLVAFFLPKMIPTKIRYKTNNRKLLAIVEALMTWRHCLEGCKYEGLILTDHNNLQCFMNTKNLSSRQVCWAQKLLKYHF